MDAFDFRSRADRCSDDEVEEIAYRVIGAAIEVHRHLGPGLPESVYKKALSRELSLLEILHECEKEVPVEYKGVEVGKGWIDILVIGKLVVELKAVESLSPIHRAQVIADLQATKLELGLLINFNVIVLKDGIKRVILSRGIQN